MRINHERPLFVLLELLKENDIYIISRKVKVKRSKLIDNPLQELVLTLLLRGGCFYIGNIDGGKVYEYVYQDRVYKYVYGKGSIEAKGAYYTNTCTSNAIVDADDIREKLSQVPIIVIDYKFWDLLLDKERNRLLLQTIFTLYTVRKYLWDQNLAITNIPNTTVYQLLNQWLGEHKVRLIQGSIVDLIDEVKLDYSDVILLDPNADRHLTLDEVMKAKIFIIGGIVDRIIPRHGLTSKLIEDIDVVRRKITLKDDVVGVPHRINKIAEIILSSRYVYSSIIQSIRYSQSKIDARWRAYIELAKTLKKKGTIGSSKLDTIYKNLSVWLNINPKDFIIVKRRLRLETDATD